VSEVVALQRRRQQQQHLAQQQQARWAQLSIAHTMHTMYTPCTYHGHGHTTHPVQAHWAQQQLNDRQPVGAVKLSRHPSQSEASPLKLKGLSYSFLLDEVMLADEH
jgi:hypothetical protein